LPSLTRCFHPIFKVAAVRFFRQQFSFTLRGTLYSSGTTTVLRGTLYSSGTTAVSLQVIGSMHLNAFCSYLATSAHSQVLSHSLLLQDAVFPPSAASLQGTVSQPAAASSPAAVTTSAHRQALSHSLLLQGAVFPGPPSAPAALTTRAHCKVLSPSMLLTLLHVPHLLLRPHVTASKRYLSACCHCYVIHCYDRMSPLQVAVSQPSSSAATISPAAVSVTA
jgi:hypothetical protein